MYENISKVPWPLSKSACTHTGSKDAINLGTGCPKDSNHIRNVSRYSSSHYTIMYIIADYTLISVAWAFK